MKKHAKKNPKIGTHPDLFKKDQWGLDPEHTDVFVEDWRLLSVPELKKAAEEGVLTEEDYAEMSDYEDQADADGDVDVLVKDGMSRKLAYAIRDGLKDELLELDEAAVERNAKPFIDWIRNRAEGQLEYEAGDKDGNNVGEGTTDAFISDLDHANMSVLIEAAQEAIGSIDLSEIQDQTALEEILKDPDMYDLTRIESGYRRDPDVVWSWQIGDVYDQCDGARYDKELDAIVNGGSIEVSSEWTVDDEHPNGHWKIIPVKVVHYPGLSKRAIDFALKELENEFPYVSIGSYQSRKEGRITARFFEKSFDMSIGAYADCAIVASANGEKILAALQDLLKDKKAKIGRTHDDVVYVYPGTNEFVAGASAKGMYVARLKPEDLKREGAAQGICIGTENLGHPAALRKGETQVFSIRTEAGKPKFTIELQHRTGTAAREYRVKTDGKEWAIAEVKGKANRLPGFAAGTDQGFTKPDDLRLVTDFLMHLGFSPEAIATASDTAPGVRAMRESGADPFKPPPVKKKRKEEEGPTPNPALSPMVARLVARTRPMGAI